MKDELEKYLEEFSRFKTPKGMYGTHLSDNEADRWKPNDYTINKYEENFTERVLILKRPIQEPEKVIPSDKLITAGTLFTSLALANAAILISEMYPSLIQILTR